MTPVTGYLLCLVTQRTGSLELGQTQPCVGPGAENRSENFSFFGSRGMDLGAELPRNLSLATRPGRSFAHPNAPQRWKERGGWYRWESIHPSYCCSSVDSHKHAGHLQPTHPKTPSCIPSPPTPSSPPCRGIPSGNGDPRLGHPKLSPASLPCTARLIPVIRAEKGD